VPTIEGTERGLVARGEIGFDELAVGGSAALPVLVCSCQGSTNSG
jgi:hypothetical protein